MAQTDDAEDKPLTTSEDVRKAVETARAEDESDPWTPSDTGEGEDDAEAGAADGEASESDKSDADQGDSTDEADDTTDEEDSKPDAKPGAYRYNQFAGDGRPETYLANLEKAYENSSSEGIRLNQENSRFRRQLEAVQQAAGSDPELANKLHAALTGQKVDPATSADTNSQATTSPLANPFLVQQEREWQKKSEQEVDEIIKANPEVVSDENLNKRIRGHMEAISAQVWKDEQRLMTAGEAMEAAFRVLGIEDKRKVGKEVSDTKRAVAASKPAAPRKSPSTGADFTDLQLQFAAKAGLSKEKLEKFAK